jgi:hypothetical protein
MRSKVSVFISLWGGNESAELQCRLHVRSSFAPVIRPFGRYSVTPYVKRAVSPGVYQVQQTAASRVPSHRINGLVTSPLMGCYFLIGGYDNRLSGFGNEVKC